MREFVGVVKGLVELNERIEFRETIADDELIPHSPRRCSFLSWLSIDPDFRLHDFFIAGQRAEQFGIQYIGGIPQVAYPELV